MNDSTSDISIQSLSRAVRFAVACISFGLAYLHLRLSLNTQSFGAIYNDMLAGKALPKLTMFVVEHPAFFTGVSILLIAGPFATLWMKNPIRSLYVAGLLSLGNIAYLLFLWSALSAPLVEIFKGMQSGPAA